MKYATVIVRKPCDVVSRAQGRLPNTLTLRNVLCTHNIYIRSRTIQICIWRSRIIVGFVFANRGDDPECVRVNPDTARVNSDSAS